MVHESETVSNAIRVLAHPSGGFIISLSIDFAQFYWRQLPSQRSCGG